MATSPSTWDALVKGQSGVRHLDDDWARGRCRSRSPAGSPSSRPRCWSGSRPAGWTAPRSSRWSRRWRPGRTPGSTEAEIDHERLGVAMASGIGGVTTLLANYDILLEKGPRRVSPLAVPMLMPNAPAAQISLYVGARAAVNTPVSACASGNEAHLAGARPDPARPGRHRAGRRHRGGDPPAADGGVRQHDGAVEEHRRPDHGLAAVGHRPRRVRARRGRRRAGARVRGARAGARRDDLRRGARRRHHRRLPRHRPARPGRPRRRAGDRAGARRSPGSSASDIAHINAHATSTPQGDIAEGLMIHATLG